MPELPEVTTVLNKLRNQITDQRIVDIIIYYDKILDNISSEEFISKLKNQAFRKFKRRGKYLILEMDDYYLIVHLRMEGKFRLSIEFNRQKHDHLVFKLDNYYLFYHDTRKFGKFYLYDKTLDINHLSAFKHTGIDALSDEYNLEYLKSKLKKNQKLKAFLLDQSIVAGVGNIYADEISFLLKLHPESIVNHLSDDELTNLIITTKQVLSQAIILGGTSVHSFSALDVSGLFQNQLKVYGKENQACPRCESKISKYKLNGRGTHLCLKCQERK